MSGRINFLTMKVLKNAITKSSSSDEMGLKKPLFMRVASKFI